MNLFNLVELSEKKRLKYDDIISGKHYYVKVDNEEEKAYMYVLVIYKGNSLIYDMNGITYIIKKILKDSENNWEDYNNDNGDDDDNFLCKKIINSRNKEVMIFE